MRFFIVALMAALAVVLPVTQSLAEEIYYIELGNNVKDAVAVNAQWDALAAKYPDLLKSLKHYPKAVVHHSQRIGADILAGPLGTKPKADKICKKLFANNVPCFVAQGLTQPPEYSDAPDTSALPWLAPVPQAAEPVKTNELETGHMPRRGLLSWLGEDENKPAPVSPPPASEPLPAAQEKVIVDANVEVADAIHVPPGAQEAKPQPVVNSPTPVTVKSLPEAKRKPIKATDNDGQGWLNVYQFTNNDAAETFWQGVREQFPQKTAGMRVRVIRPVLAVQGNAPASLSIGQFENHADADTFCHDSIQTLNNTLQCRFELGEAPAANAVRQPVATRYEHADAYAARRRTMMLQRSNADAKPAEWTRSMAPAGDTYWVQVLSADSEMEALQGWEDIRTANSDLLEGTRSNVSASLGSHHKAYVVRVGPIAKNDDALSLCKSLGERGVKCSVMLASGM